MRGIITFLLIFILNAPSWSQQGSNPFDIEGRTPVINSALDSLKNTNVFDRLGSQTEGENSNPFDISHIPLDKKEIRKTKIASENRAKSHLFDFRFFVLLGLLILFTLIMALFRKEVFSLVKPMMNLNILELMNRDSQNGRNAFFTLSYIFFIANAAFLIYHIAIKWMESGWKLMLWLFLGILGIYVLKHIFLGLMGYTFPIQKSLSRYSFMVTLHNSIAGYILFPLNILMFLSSEKIGLWLIWISLIVLIVLYLIRILRGSLSRSNAGKSNILHFFLYLCGSEIAPIVLIFGLINQ